MVRAVVSGAHPLLQVGRQLMVALPGSRVIVCVETMQCINTHHKYRMKNGFSVSQLWLHSQGIFPVKRLVIASVQADSEHYFLYLLW